MPNRSFIHYIEYSYCINSDVIQNITMKFIGNSHLKISIYLIRLSLVKCKLSVNRIKSESVNYLGVFGGWVIS